MSEYITHSRAETVALGARMAAVLTPGSLVAFTGGLGAGKTAFTEGLAEGLGCTDPVSSPTFAIVNYYRGPSRWRTLTCTVFPLRTTCVLQAFTIIWIRGPLWQQSGARTLQTCWHWKTPSGWTSNAWTRTPAESPLRG